MIYEKIASCHTSSFNCYYLTNQVFAEKNVFFDSVKFIQYLDENTALEEVRNGNLDMYYYRISSDRLENQSR